MFGVLNYKSIMHLNTKIMPAKSSTLNILKQPLVYKGMQEAEDGTLPLQRMSY